MANSTKNELNLKSLFWGIEVAALFLIIILIGGFWISFYLNKAVLNPSQQTLIDPNLMVKKCSRETDWRSCYGFELSSIIGRAGFDKALEIFYKIAKLDGKTADCHLIAHQMAQKQVKLSPQNWGQMFGNLDQNSCMGGFVHGVVEGLSDQNQSFILNSQSILDICQKIKKTTGNSDLDPCFHALGHVLLTFKKGDIAASSKICLNLPLENQSSCLDGVFMENITRTGLVEHGIAEPLSFNKESAAELERLCSLQSGKTRTACFRELSHMYVVVAGYEPQKVNEFCHQAKLTYDQDQCYIHSFNSMVENSNFDNKNLPLLCNIYDSDQTKLGDCLNWVLINILSSPNKSKNRAMLYCQSLEAGQKKICQQKLEQKISQVGKRVADE